VNTADKKVLEALFYTSPAMVDNLVKEAPYKSIEDIRAKNPKLPSDNKTIAPYGVQSSYFEVEVATLFGRYQRTTQALIQRGAGAAGFRILWLSQRLPYRLAGSETTSGENPDTKPGENI
jgi:type II secretory pathway component PulK